MWFLPSRWRIFNSSTSSVRSSAEWLFGDISNDFKYPYLKKILKIGLSSVGKMYIVSAFLKNPFTCLYRNTTSMLFDPIWNRFKYVYKLPECKHMAERKWGRSTCTRCFKASINREYLGTRRYEISLRVFNSIAHEWAQRTCEMSNWTREEKFNMHALFCLLCKHNSPLLTRIVNFIYKWK